MKKIIKLTEDDLSRIIQRVIRESDEAQYAEPSAELIASLSSDTEDSENDSSLFDDDISKAKNCFVNAKKVPTTHGRPGMKFDFPTKCEKGFSDECVETMFGEITKFMGDRQKNSSLGNCLLKISSLKPKLWKHMEGMS